MSATLSLVTPPVAGERLVHRMPDRERVQPQPKPGHKLLATELASVTGAFAPYEAAVAALHANQEATGKARRSQDPVVRATVAELDVGSEALKREVLTTRGDARVAVLHALDAAGRRAGAQYHAAAQILAECAGTLEGLAMLRDGLLGQSNFDPLGCWTRSAILAPPLPYRPTGWSVTPDSWGRDCWWTAMSVAHGNVVRRTQEATRAEIVEAAGPAPWPFD